jgi:transposase
VSSPGKPSPRDEVVIAALTGGMSQRKTSQVTGVSMSTVHRVSMRYRADIEQARREQARTIAQELKDRARYAVTRLEEVLDSANEPIVLGAIRTALTEASRWMEAVEIEERLAEVERRLAERG